MHTPVCSCLMGNVLFYWCYSLSINISKSVVNGKDTTKGHSFFRKRTKLSDRVMKQKLIWWITFTLVYSACLSHMIERYYWDGMWLKMDTIPEKLEIIGGSKS
ncbi:hypothetical protein VCUG_01258 [Vavraia culicis subsp. floridensis]|uniref:Uncharacterized protein n=1 Tax=Vavraia culicis (isolate floridensis) TaxID=948595 RepID=L2GV72_VAVCU|nr:uncharacterized protein VCUG_01258 [Vavraia culicis subsp. floridensis]ELA47262.1 hypothetical protein VCUG_01258 [Vavraia culicis subsp. floridensis]